MKNDVISLFIKRAFLFLIMYFMFDALKSFAGKDTTAYVDLFTSLLVNLKADKWVAYLFAVISGGSGTILFIRERKLRRESEQFYISIINLLQKEVKDGSSV